MEHKKAEDTVSPLSQVAYWDAVSGGYSHIARMIMAPFSAEVLRLVPVEKSYSVLDMACGTGILSVPLSREVRSVTAADFSHKMLSELQSHIKANGIGNIDIQQCDGQDLPYEANHFDAAFSMFGLMFFPDRAKGFRELHRVVKPGGRVAVSGWAPLEKSLLMTLLFDALKVAWPEAPPMQKRTIGLDNPDDFKREMEEGEFEEVVIHEVKRDVAPIDPVTFWRIMAEGGPLVAVKREVGKEKWEDMSVKAISFLVNKVGEHGSPTFTTAYIGVGTKPENQV